MISTLYLGLSVQIATVVAPVAVYFLILGILNSRRHPQLLSGRQDFALLIAALSPLFVLPVLEYVGTSVLTVLAAVAGLVGLILLLAPRGHAWVIYNLSQSEARAAVTQALRRTHAAFREAPAGFALGDGKGRVEIGGFPLLRNAWVRLRGAEASLAGRFGADLSAVLAETRAEHNATGVSLLLVATAMLIAPLTLVAQDVPEIVRLVTDLF